ncbi:TPM domain-containing protein [Sandaracinobacteroides hominis]|uniref:TPM domain-containing protein n=1 Tax=Sandaracinobacteroides hominis TaxID=2780086 RepID=UPI0018F35660|nr:TPM domain-containing protein [Sandaracinobacteroides hominis]
MRLLALLLLLLASPLAAQQFPALTGRVVDAANILPPDVVAQITARSEAIEKQTTAQVVVATVPDLQGYEIEEYGYRLGRAWGIGQKREAGGKGDNGVILLVAPNERRVRIEVGYGLEPVLTDALSSVIISQAILPKFRAGDMAGGVLDGFDQIAKQVELPPEQAAANVKAAEARAAQQGPPGGGISLGTILFFLFLAFWIFSVIRRAKGGKRASRGGPIVIWGPGMGGGWGGGGGGGWGGGGGFGGGGGGFGGGGASGGW